MALDPPQHRFLKKQDNRFNTDDINLPRPRFFFRKLDRRLDISDIEGATSIFYQPKLNRSQRCVNPLTPVYKLATFRHEPPEPMRFTRDTLDISDIEGTRTTVPIVLRMKTRDHINYSDVKGSTAAHTYEKWQSRTTRPILKVDDINNDGAFRTRRHTDPLSPRYDFDCNGSTDLLLFAENGNPLPREGGGQMHYEGGAHSIPGSHPRKTKDASGINYSLMTRDIDGNEPMFNIHRITRLMKNHTTRKTNTTDDIEGAQADTALKSTWLRRTNPLMPKYQPLDNGDPEFNPYSCTNIGTGVDSMMEQRQSSYPGQDVLYSDVERQRLHSSGSQTESVISGRSDPPRPDLNLTHDQGNSDTQSIRIAERMEGSHIGEQNVDEKKNTQIQYGNVAPGSTRCSSVIKKEKPSNAPPRKTPSISSSKRSSRRSSKTTTSRPTRKMIDQLNDQALVRALPTS